MSTQENYLKGIADAIRAKTGESGLIPANEFAARILALHIAQKKLKCTSVTFPSNMYVNKVIYADNKFVMQGYNSNAGDAVYSTDGVAWTVCTGIYSDNHRGIAYGNGRFVIPLNYGYVSYSDDGITWTNSTTKSIPFDSDVEVADIAYGDGKFVVIDNKFKNIAYSTDGINWTVVKISDTVLIAMQPRIAYGNGKFIVTGQNNLRPWYSTNGIEWTRATSDILTHSYGNGVRLDFINGKFIHYGYSKYMQYSADGIDWVTSELPGDYLWNISYGDGKFVGVASGQSLCIHSTDGIKWNVEYSKIQNKNWVAITNYDGKFVVLGMLSDIAYNLEFSYD